MLQSSKDIRLSKLVIVIDEDKIAGDRICMKADSIYRLNEDQESFDIQKHRYISYSSIDNELPLYMLIDCITTSSYKWIEDVGRDKVDVQDAWLKTEGYL
jgi:hypothetical protein